MVITMLNLHKQHKGFTLVELLIAIIIIGVLAGMIMITSTPVLNKTKDTADIATLKTLNTATTTYKMSSGVYSNSDIFYNYNTDADRLNALLIGSYISSLPVSNKKGSFYMWRVFDQKWDLVHVLNDSEITVVLTGWYKNSIMGSYSGSETVFDIPATINGVAMLQIMQDVFRGKNLDEVTLAEGLERLHARAFKDNNLTEIRLPNSLNRIDTLAFSGNPLTKITIGSGVTIETDAFPQNGSFLTAYASGGAGTYSLIGIVWTKQ